jgi:YVTN family beta-propeller protein
MKPLLQPTAIQSFSYSFLCVLFLVFTACGDGDNPAPRGRYDNGVFIVNEGVFGLGNGEISFFDLDSNKVTNNIFGQENKIPNSATPRPLGDVIQSMIIHNDVGYIVANITNKVLIVDASTFRQTAEIPLEQPRYITARNTKGYVTEWRKGYGDPDGGVAVLDLTSNTVTKRIKTGPSPENLLIYNDKLYVTNKATNLVSIINLTTEVVETTLTTPAGPNSLVLDKNNQLWVLCGGIVQYDDKFNVIGKTNGALIQVNPVNNTITQTLPFSDTDAERLIANPTKDRLYYTFQDKLFVQDISANALNTQTFLNRDFYGVAINPAGDILYGGIAPNFRDNGRMVRFNLATKAPLDSVTVGIAPNGFVFRQ